jgi:hypothetical protein
LQYPVSGLVDSTVAGVTGLIAKEESPAALFAELDVVLRKKSVYEELRLNAWKRSFAFQWDQVFPTAFEWLEQQAARSR